MAGSQSSGDRRMTALVVKIQLKTRQLLRVADMGRCFVPVCSLSMEAATAAAVG